MSLQYEAQEERTRLRSHLATMGALFQSNFFFKKNQLSYWCSQLEYLEECIRVKGIANERNDFPQNIKTNHIYFP